MVKQVSERTKYWPPAYFWVWHLETPGVLPQKCEEDTPETTTVTTMQRFTPIVTLLLIDQPKRNKE